MAEQRGTIAKRLHKKYVTKKEEEKKTKCKNMLYQVSLGVSQLRYLIRLGTRSKRLAVHES